MREICFGNSRLGRRKSNGFWETAVLFSLCGIIAVGNRAAVFSTCGLQYFSAPYFGGWRHYFQATLYFVFLVNFEFYNRNWITCAICVYPPEEEYLSCQKVLLNSFSTGDWEVNFLSAESCSLCCSKWFVCRSRKFSQLALSVGHWHFVSAQQTTKKLSTWLHLPSERRLNFKKNKSILVNWFSQKSEVVWFALVKHSKHF